MTHDLLPARRPSVLVGGGLLTLALTLGLSACGSDGGGGGSAAATSAAPSGAASTGAASTGAAATDTAASGGTDSGSGDGAATAACVADSDYLSGTSTVIWTPDGKSKHQLAQVTADNKFTLTAAGALDPATIEVAVDEVFSVTMADDSTGISVLKIGCDGGQTMTKGTPAGIYITAPGTYRVTSGIEEKAAGTIVVE